ncbi:MAG: ribosomal-processing cysteine protease Prp [Clostridium sp.]
MIQATVLKDSRDSGNVLYRGIVIEGHAGYAEEGEDIICAAVSALAINFYNSVETFTEDPFEGLPDRRTFSLTFGLPQI